MYRLQRRRRTAVFYDREHGRKSTLEPLQVFFTFVMAHGCYERSNGQRERRHLVILFQHNLTAANLAEDAALCALSPVFSLSTVFAELSRKIPKLSLSPAMVPTSKSCGRSDSGGFSVCDGST